MSRRVGSLAHPGRYGKSSCAVYEGVRGFFIVLDGVREYLHGNQLWTRQDGVSMRGTREAMGEPDDELARAIRASLEEAALPEAPPAPAADAAPPGDAPAGEAPTASEELTCKICLTAAIGFLNRPCNHLVACAACSRRLVRQPCPICRRNVNKVERVFFA